MSARRSAADIRAALARLGYAFDKRGGLYPTALICHESRRSGAAPVAIREGDNDWFAYCWGCRRKVTARRMARRRARVGDKRAAAAPAGVPRRTGRRAANDGLRLSRADRGLDTRGAAAGSRNDY